MTKPHKPGPKQKARMEKIQQQIELKTVVGPVKVPLNIYLQSMAELDNKLPGVRASDIGGAVKFDQDKLPLHLLSTEALNQTAAVLAFGAQKYAEHNWRNGFTWSRPLAAAMRHITAFNAGEDKDPESGLSHLAHAACCIMFLLEFEKTHPELDDRYRPRVPEAD